MQTKPEAPLVKVLAETAADTLFLAQWNSLGARTRWVRTRRPIQYADAPVLMLPGVYESPHFLDPLADVARASSRPVYSVASLGHNRGRILDSALLVEAFLVEHDLTSVTILAHSKGGLIGKQLMVWPQTAGRIRSMIAVATPFAGSRYARRAPGRVLRDFSPADATLRDLGANLEANSRIVSVYGPFDPQIPDGSELAGARNVPLATPGHFRPLADPRLHRLVGDILTAERTTDTINGKK